MSFGLYLVIGSLPKKKRRKKERVMGLIRVFMWAGRMQRVGEGAFESQALQCRGCGRIMS